jgi:acetyl-CoA carboxylase beta subunit
MLGDINIAEPGALMDLLDLEVRDTTGKDLPEGFQLLNFYWSMVS